MLIDELLIYCRGKLNTEMAEEDQAILNDCILLESAWISFLKRSESLALYIRYFHRIPNRLFTEDRLLLIIRFLKDILQHTTHKIDVLIQQLCKILKGHQLCVSIYTACLDLPLSSLAVIDLQSVRFQPIYLR